MMTLKDIPGVGAAVEAIGVLCTVIDADMMNDGEVHITVQASSSNITLLANRCRVQMVEHLAITSTLIRLPVGFCTWRKKPAGGLFDVDDQTMLGHTGEDLEASMSAVGFQRMLSRRSRL